MLNNQLLQVHHMANSHSTDHVYVCKYVSLKNKVNRPVMKLDDENNICDFYDS